MAYFLKKSKLKKGLYLQIYESFYDPKRKQSAHKSFKALGYLDDLIEGGIDDPIAFFQAEVDRLNAERKQKKEAEQDRLISDVSPETLLGYVPLKAVHDKLGVKKYIDLMQTSIDVEFNVFSLLSSLIYSRAVAPCSKSKTFHDVIPKLGLKTSFSKSQMYDGIAYLGQEYEKIIEIYNHMRDALYPIDTSTTFFDGTNFYFEIDREDDFRKRGPSKEQRKDPIVGLGLLLDADQIPIGMKLYPGNESEKPVMRQVIGDLKQRLGVTGRTVRVADKGLNCAENILHAKRDQDGYLFSKSVKMLPQTEIDWVLLADGYRSVTDSNGELIFRSKSCVDKFPYTYVNEEGKRRKVYLTEKRVVYYSPVLAKKHLREIDRQVNKARHLQLNKAKRSEFGDSAKYVLFKAKDKRSGELTDDNVIPVMNEQAILRARQLAGFNLLVTSEVDMSDQKIYDVYHNLWRIEESFRVMKSQLDARPVYLQKKDTITGHFLICYLTVLLTRLLQFKVLNNNYGSEEIFDFMHSFKVVKLSEYKYINISKGSPFISDLTSSMGLPFNRYFLKRSDITKMLSARF